MKKNLKELRNNGEAQLDSIVDILFSLQIAVVIIDRSSHEIIFVNNKAAEISLTTPKHMTGKKCSDTICRKGQDECFDCDLNRSFLNEGSELVRSDGSIRPILKSVTSVNFNGRNCLLVSYIDISELQKSEAVTGEYSKKLQTNTERLALAMEVAREGVWDLNIARNILDFDSTIYVMAGYSPGEYPGLFEEWEKRVYPDDLETARIDLENFLSQKNERYHSEFRFLRKDESYMWIKAIGKVVEVDDSGKPIRYIAILTDISSQKMREKRAALTNSLQSQLIKPGTLAAKTKMITDSLISAIDADFARIWLMKPADLCEKGCLFYNSGSNGKLCNRDGLCLHLLSSSGRYTHLDGDHRRIPIGAKKIGGIFSGKYDRLVINGILEDDRIPGKKWAEELGLVSFAGFRLEDSDENEIGVLALFSKDDINPEIEAYIQSIANLTSQVIINDKAEEKIRKYTETIERDLEEKKQMLKKATMLQKSFIQKTIPLMDTLNIRALFMPCENLGGDFFRVLKGVHHDKMVIIIGDCTDHGIKASMDASLLSSLIDPNLLDLYYDNRTDDFLKRISLDYIELADEDQFPTMMVLVFDMYTGDLYYSNANSELPFLIRNNQVERIEKAEGMHIGYYDNPVFERKHIHFQPGDRLLLYSDAITEIKKKNGLLVGHKGIKRILEKSTGNAEDCFDSIIEEIREEKGALPLDDDATLLLIEYSEHKKIQFQFNCVNEWKSYSRTLKEDFYSFDFDTDEIEKICIAIDEMCINAFVHGNKRDTDKSVILRGSINCKGINLFIEDEGEGFSPDSVPDPRIIIEKMMEGEEVDFTHGRGIWIAKQYLDSVEYNKKGNSVRLISQKSPRKVRNM